MLIIPPNFCIGLFTLLLSIGSAGAYDTDAVTVVSEH
jgi:hypothetical protein